MSNSTKRLTVEISDAPLEFYKFCFPDDRRADENVRRLMLNAGTKYLNKEKHRNKHYTCVEEIVKEGLGILELEVLTLAEIEFVHFNE